MNTGWLTEPIGLVLVAVITVGGTWLTNRAANRTTHHVTRETVAAQVDASRIQAEQNAFERAEATLGRTIDRQEREIKDLETDVADLKRQNAEQRNQIEDLQVDLRDTRVELARTRRELDSALAELAAAKQLLKRAYPDEP